MTNRVGKQILYGSFFVTFILGIGLLIYALFLVPKPSCSDGIKNGKETGVDCGGKCLPCEVKVLELTIADKKIIPVNSISKTTFLIRVINPSVDYWVENFAYSLKVYNTLGVLIKDYRGSSTVPPGGERLLVYPAEDFDPIEVKNIDFEVLDKQWGSIDEYVDSGIKVSKTTTAMQGKKIVTTGSVKNTSANYIPILKITAAYKNEKGAVVNVSSTVVDGLSGYASRNFQIILLPGKENIVFDKTDITTEIQK